MCRLLTSTKYITANAPMTTTPIRLSALMAAFGLASAGILQRVTMRLSPASSSETTNVALIIKSRHVVNAYRTPD